MTALRSVASEADLSCDLAIGGLACRLDTSGALFFVEDRTLLVADLHLEKGSSLARRGSFLPPYDSSTTLGRLATAIQTHAPRRVIALGDSFHDRFGPDRLGERDRATLARLVGMQDWVWILGNHDPVLPDALGGHVAHEMSLGPLALRHAPAIGPARDVAGHLHPVAKVALHGRGVRVRAALTDGRRCVLPAFGAYAGGLNACDRAFAPLFPDGFTAYCLGRTRIFAIDHSVLCGD